jgi:hypothetical protein
MAATKRKAIMQYGREKKRRRLPAEVSDLDEQTGEEDQDVSTFKTNLKLSGMTSRTARE